MAMERTIPYTSDFLRILQERGFIHQCTDGVQLDARLNKERTSAYIGFDCTAPSLHVGSLVQIMILRWLQKTGHKPIVLLGGGTTKVGDPSGKDDARKLLSPEDINRNLESIKKLLAQFIRFGTAGADALLVNNAEWLSALNYIDFLRDAGRHFSVNRMLTQDSVRLRLEREQNLSFLEFNYMVLQAYDFVELHKRYGCALQIGGSDQWGNIIMGIELDRRMRAEHSFKPMQLPQMKPGTSLGMKVLEVQPMIRSSGHAPSAYSSENFLKHVNAGGIHALFGLTTPLLTTGAGEKMGKTVGGAVWLDGDLLSPYEYWQFWRNTADVDVGRFLRLFTELPLADIQKLEALQGAELNEAKKTLATEATRIAHGERAAKQAAESARKTFEEGASGEALPEVRISAGDIGKGIAAYELFRLSGLVDSGSEARRLIRGGGAKINDRKLTDENELLPLALFSGTPVKISAGRKRHARVVLE